MKKLLLIGASLAVIIGISIIVSSFFINEKPTDLYACATNEDCVYQNIGEENQLCTYGCVSKETKSNKCFIETLLGAGDCYTHTRISCSCVDTKCREGAQEIKYTCDYVRSKLTFPTTISSKPYQKGITTIEIKNTLDQEIKITMQFEVKTVSNFTQFTSQQDLLFQNRDGITTTASIAWNNTPQSLKPGEMRLIPVTLVAPSNTGSYLYKITLFDEKSEPYDSKSFFVKVTPE